MLRERERERERKQRFFLDKKVQKKGSHKNALSTSKVGQGLRS